MVASETRDKAASSIALAARDVAVLTEELSTLLSAHLELDRALQIMRDANHDQTISDLLELLHRRIHEGADFSAALMEHPQSFSPTYVNLVRAGELGGNLAEVVSRLSNYLNMMQGLRDRVISAIVYPAILLLVAAISLIVVLVFVLPEFEELFVDMGVTLPLITRLVMAVSNLFVQFWWLIVAVSVFGYWYLRSRYRDPGGRIEIDNWMIRLPLIGGLIRNWETARFSRNLSVLARQGVPLTESIGIAADAVGNRAIAESLHVAAGDLRLGGTISERLIEDKTLPLQASQMIKIGEESGELAEMLERVAVLYDRKVRAGIERGLAMLEPVLVLVLAGIIAVIVFSILLAILGLSDVPI